MSKKLIYLASMVNVLNLELCKTYSIRSAGKVSLFRDFVLAVFLSVACSLLTAMPVAYGEEGYALEVNGGTVTIDDDEDALRLSSYTYEFWMKDLQGPTGSWRNVFCKGPGDTAAGRGPLLALHPDDPGLHFSHSTGSGQETANTQEGVPVNEWTHIALVLTALDGEQIIYQDGVQVAVESVFNLTDATQSPVLRIGLGANVVLDDFRIWNYARTQAEIQADMNREIFGVEEGLVGYWRFNEGEGTTAYDMSAYENHGNITAAAWITEAAPITPGTPPVFASRPDPANGAVYADTWVNLSWRPGDFALSHDVYFGDNFDDVNAGAEGTFLGNQTGTYFLVGFLGFPYPDGLVPGTTYYWRIDGVNDTEPNSPWKGPVWSFWIPPRKAYEPVPPDGAKYIDQNVVLSWTAGFGAKFHTVYFGDNFDDVNNAVVGVPQSATTFTPGTVELEKTYYWRVDEFDGLVTYKGDLWSFKTLPDIPIIDPNLVGWWKLDEGTGTTVLDRSGHGNHGTLRGDPQWVIGHDGDALEFDGSGAYVDCGNAEVLNIDVFSVSFWYNLPSSTQGWNHMISRGSHVASGSPGSVNWGVMMVSGAQRILFETYDDTSWIGIRADTTAGEWHHAVATYDGDTMQLYYDGALADTTSGRGILLDQSRAFLIGARSDAGSAGGFFSGSIDDVHIYNKVLTQDEVNQIMRGDTTLAWDPSPAHNSTPDIYSATLLSWSPGEKAAQHDVYFGTDRDAVADADESDTTGIYRGRQAVTSYNPPEGVEWGGGPYYWRIDEYNTDATISKGNVWSFTVADFIGIDDFEDYDVGNNEIWWVWLDGLGYASHPTLPDYPGNGTGSAVGDETTDSYTEETIVHGGSQSMPYWYDNNKPDKFKYSEAELTLTYPRDWTEKDVNTLTIWFRGNPAGFVEGPVGTYTINAAGADIWNDADEFRYAYKQLSGAGTISAQVLSVENTNTWAKAGVMIRESLDPGSKFAAVYITPGNGCRFQARLQTGANATSDSDVTTLQNITAPQWIKLERDAAGNFNAYNSDDGVTWTPLAWNPQRITMPSNVYIGLALTSHSAGVTCKAEFSDVQTTGTVSPMIWTHEAIGATMASNDAEPMYVAVNGSAVVYHDNPNAALITDWTEWNIDLQAFADLGVSLTNVNTLAVGFGDKTNPQIGGSGKVYFDDIRLYRPLPEPEPAP